MYTYQFTLANVRIRGISMHMLLTSITDLEKQKHYYSQDFELEAIKEPVWHRENGTLRMGILNDPKQVTYYFSFSNLTAKGELILDGQEHEVHGKAWNDKQGGTYSLTNYRTNWEWFSLPFFDDEEVMLFSFPPSGAYTLRPRMGGQFNVFSYELLADIIDARCAEQEDQ